MKIIQICLCFFVISGCSVVNNLDLYRFSDDSEHYGTPDADADSDSDADEDTDTLCPECPRTCILRVKQDAASNGDGLSWKTAFNSLNDALLEAKNKEEPCDIWVSQGSYSAYINNRTDTFALFKSVRLFGGFAGNETEQEERSLSDNETILDGANETNTDAVFHVITGASDTVLDGFTITGGNANGREDSQKYGGGLYCSSSKRMTVSNCIFTNNNAEVYGGGIHLASSSLTIDNVVFRNNISKQSGGGLSVLNLSASTELVIKNSKFHNNEAATGGGGVFVGVISSPIFENCEFTQNSVPESGLGGAMQIISGTTPQIVNCIFWNNTANLGGGIAIILDDYKEDRYVSFERSIFINNIAQGVLGGAIYASDDVTVLSILFNECIFSNNITSDGYSRQGSVLYLADSSEVSFNRCVFAGNGIGNDQGTIAVTADSHFEMENSVMAGNIAFAGSAFYQESTYASIVRNSTFYMNTDINTDDDSEILSPVQLHGESGLTIFNTILYSEHDPEYVNMGTGIVNSHHNLIENLDNKDSKIIGTAPTFNNTPAYGRGWTSVDFNQNTFQTELLDNTLDLNTDELKGLFVKLETDERRYYIAGNTKTAVFVWGDVTGSAAIGGLYIFEDLKLGSGSTGIDAGTSDNAPKSDFDKKERQDNKSVPDTGSGTYTYYDIGAFES